MDRQIVWPRIELGAEMHNNLFRYGHSTKEVYEALQRDFRRDSAVTHFFDYATLGALTLAALDLWGGREWWLFAAFGAGATSLRYFIDQSNRNHLMHMIDWTDAQRREEEERRQEDVSRFARSADIG